ncbi:MAG: hypothetical protein H6722_21285 [Sandaracinus sp.]|nr:hypothetical protein [Sandaracinus sp.]MCB9614978.1 hypothetical protein [Sandaracinus sp.]
MCRYAFHTYKEPFACFDCRKYFKQTSRWELPEHQRPREGEPRVVPCPQCGVPMADMGHDFKPPAMRDVKQWEKVRFLFDHGFSFHSCGCCGPGYRPEDLAEVEAFLVSSSAISEGERLLRKFMRPRESAKR